MQAALLLTQFLYLANAISFRSTVIDKSFDAGTNSIEAGILDDSKNLSLVTLSQGGAIRWYDTTGKSVLIANLTKAQHHSLADVNGDGYLDVVVSYNFGGCPMNCTAADGDVAWLENPRGNKNVEWKLHPLPKPKNPAHRIVVVGSGSNLTIVSVALSGITIPGTDPFLTPMAITYYKKSENFSKQYILSRDFTICHEGKASGNKLTISCGEGLIEFEWDGNTFSQGKQLIPELQFDRKFSNYTGISSADFLKPGYYPFIGPFHGGNVGLLTPSGIKFFDNFGNAAGHDIRILDANTFAVAFRQFHTGIYVYRVENDKLVERKFIYDGPATYMTVGDFNGDGKVDIASLNWGGSGNSDLAIHYRLD